MATTALTRSGLNLAPNNNTTINLTWPERYASIAAGVQIGLSGLKRIFRHPFASIIKLGASGYLLNRGITGHCELYSQIGKVSTEPVNVKIKSSFKVNKPRTEVYNFWRKLDNLPKFMSHLERVDVIDD